MSLFIVRPKLRFEDRVSSALPLFDRHFTPERRLAQIQEVTELLKEDPVQRQLRRWIGETLPAAATQTTPPVRTEPSPVVGAAVLDLTDEQAEQLRKDLPEVDVIPDRAMHLIEPARPREPARQAKKKLTIPDRWHLQKCGVLARTGTRKTRMTGAGVTVAVFDTGIAAEHREFQRGRNCVVDKAFKFDTAAWQAVPSVGGRDGVGHGTHVAGLIAGATTGVAPDVRVIDAAVMPTGRCQLSDLLLALEWAATTPAIQILNLSVGIAGYEPGLEEVCDRLEAFGVLAVVAVGNAGRNRTGSPGNYRSVLTVGAANRQNEVPAFSGSGELMVDHHLYSVPDVVAPGVGVYSCVPGAENTYEPWDGTSMATPIVTGLAALHLQRDPGIRLADLRERILEDAIEIPTEEDARQGYGVVRFE